MIQQIKSFKNDAERDRIPFKTDHEYSNILSTRPAHLVINYNEFKKTPLDKIVLKQLKKQYKESLKNN